MQLVSKYETNIYFELCFHLGFINSVLFWFVLKSLKMLLLLLTAGFAHPVNTDVYLLTFINFF